MHVEQKSIWFKGFINCYAEEGGRLKREGVHFLGGGKK